MAQKLTILAALLTFTLMLATSLSSSKPSTQNRKPMSIRATIMHRNAKGSPMHDPSATPDQIRETDFQISRQRAEYFYQKKSSPKSIESVQAETEIMESSFIMKFKIGTPPIDTYGYIDTGSALCWAQCAPCMLCYKQHGTIYNETTSSSYKRVPWGDPMCSQEAIGGKVENLREECSYIVRYAGKSISAGNLAQETFTFQGGYELNDILFGCSMFNRGRDYSPPAMIGLANYSASLVRQLSISQFSYYVQYTAKSINMVGVIELGTPALETNSSIPLVSGNGLYYLALDKIFVAGEQLDVPDRAFQYGIIIDSGTTYTALEPYIFDVLKIKLVEEMGQPLPDKGTNICYRSIRRAPSIDFEFKGHYMELCQSRIWYRSQGNSESYCLAMHESPRAVSIFGMYQQRSFKVAYDLDRGCVNMTEMQSGQCPEFG